MKVIVGLGNPGGEYVNSRHNVGFWAAEWISHAIGVATTKNKFNGLFSETHFGSEKIGVLMPHTYMNLSGRSVREVIQFFKIPASNILVIYDDFDIPLGTLRFRLGGSSGTHNGMKSIVSEIGTTEFCRLRIGIGPKVANRSVSDFVLSMFSQLELQILESVAPAIEESIRAWIVGDCDRASRICGVIKAPGHT